MREMHGLSHVNGKRTPLHRLWLNLRNRCNNHKTHDYKYYGARGVSVCPAWDSFTQFVKDVGPHPGGGLTLDRIDTNKGYEPGNVRWATRETQARNRNYCTLDEVKAEAIRQEYGPYTYMARGRTKGPTQKQLAEKYGVSQGHISHVLRGVTWK